MSVEDNEKNSVIVKKENNFEEKIENKQLKREDCNEASDEDEYQKVGTSRDVSDHKMSVEDNEKNSVIVIKQNKLEGEI